MQYSEIKEKLSSKEVYLHSFVFLFCVLFAFCFRGYICDREIARVKSEIGANFAPFEVESAIMYSYINDVADGKGIPEYDPRLKLTCGYRVNEQMSLGVEYFLGWGLLLRRALIKPKIPPDSTYENNPEETSWIITQLRLWACLVPGTGLFVADIYKLPLAYCPAWRCVVFGGSRLGGAPHRSAYPERNFRPAVPGGSPGVFPARI